MLDKQKVKLMTELAFYEQNQGKEDFKINEYYRKDYVSFHTLCSVIWVTIGYVCVWGLGLIAGMDWILENISKSVIIMLILAAIIGYIFLVIIYALIVNHMYDQKHRIVRQRMKKYNHNLTRLLKMYEKEKR